MDNSKDKHMLKDFCICLSVFYFLYILKQQGSVERNNTELFMASAIEIEYLFVLYACEWVWGQQTARKVKGEETGRVYP